MWPGGLTGGGTFAQPFIDYDCATQPFSDPYGIWGFADLAQRYLAGSGLLAGQFSAPFNSGTGFSTCMAASFADNDPSHDQRPAVFCGQPRQASDRLQNSTSPYNQAWFAYVAAMQAYLSELGYLDQAYHYIANEPQNQADYDAVAWYSGLSHTAAPGLRLMVPEAPRPEIYEQPGVEAKFTGWFLWKYRLGGLAHYSLDDWSKNPWTEPLTDGQRVAIAKRGKYPNI